MGDVGKTMDVLADRLMRLLEHIMILCMVVMLVMVFGNVMLRMFFNTGIDVSEEIPRFAFVWLTFLGAVVGMRRRAHLGVDVVVRLLPMLGRRVCWGISQVVILVCCGYMVYGTWLEHDIIAGNTSPVAQLSMIWVYGVSYITGVVIALMCLNNLLRLLQGRVRDDELIDVREEGMDEALEAEHALQEQIASSAPPSLRSKP